MLIKNGMIFTMGEMNFEKGDILIKDGKIVDVSENINVDDEYIIDANGATIIPGMIDAHCHLGLIEENMGQEGSNVNEVSDPITPQIRAIDGINPLDGGFKKAVKAGITTVVSGPGSANVIGGSFAAIKTHGICIDDMIVKSPVAMKVAFGENPKRVYKGKNKAPMTRMANAAMLRETIIEAKNYLNKKNIAKEKGEFFEEKLKYEALIPVLNREIPLKAHAHRADDILTAIRIAKEFDLRLTLDHVTEGHLITSHIKKSGYGAIVGPTLSFNSKIELTNRSFKTSVELIKAGVKTAIMTDHPVTNIERLPLCVALTMKEGLSFLEALRTVTIDAASIVGIDDKVGSIEKGKDADIVILDGSPFDIATKTLYTIINGEVVYKAE
ncbi:Imidazolonepropionase [Clostridium cavendishii DSM 21758]|uniref:Imidazolonepropionase n=1 Tax=Clostridium cavendishii DSM 21758 TaxID=1121302 RepID=A0A1M6NQS5_9CLOT|nr:amidohydrolase [Clostridium cavendishii]SHJ98101.1 Imidazolonepropionase [Clostridium cavendishii DSM 21758]